MKAQDLFGLVVRILGLLLVFYGVWYLSYALTQILGMPEQYAGEKLSYLVTGSAALFLGLLTLRGARTIVRFTYPGNREDSGTRDEA